MRSTTFSITLALLASTGLAAAATSEPQRLRRLGRLVLPRQSGCQGDSDCPDAQVCCSGLVFGPGEGAGTGVCIDPSGCSGGTCFSGTAEGFCDA